MTPPKLKFNKEKIVDAAFAILKEKGWNHVSARSIANELDSSTMPIYSAISSMEDVENELRTRALETMQRYQLEKYTDNPFLNLAIGYIVFARELPHLFKFLYFERPKKISAEELQNLKKKWPEELQSLPPDYYFREITPEKLDHVTLNSWIFTHGLATFVHSGMLADIANKDIIAILENAGRAFLGGETMKGKEK